MSLTFESAVVYQPLFLSDVKKGEKKDVSAQVNRVFQIAAIIPVLSTLTALVRLYQISVVKKMAAESFSGREQEKAATLEMLWVKMTLELFGLGLVAELGNDIANHLGAKSFGQPVLPLELR